MPIFEFRCNACKRKFSALIGVVAESRPLECPRCHAADLSKLISRFSSPRSEDDRLDSLENMGDPTGLEDDPKAMRQWMRRMSQEMGDEGEDLEELMEEAMEEEAGGGGEGAEPGLAGEPE